MAKYWLKRGWAFGESSHELSSNSRIATSTVPLNYLFKSFTSWADFRYKFGTATSPMAFRHFISNIIKIGTKKQVFGILTDRIITMMENMKSLWDFSKSKFPAYSMGRIRFIVDAQLSITSILATASFTKPRPTFFNFFFINFPPKSFFKFTIKRIAMSKPTMIMKITPFSRPPRPIASFNRTISQFIPHIIIVPQNRRVI